METQLERRASPIAAFSTLRVICSWCRGEMKASSEGLDPGVANYGMCRSCLGRRLLELADETPAN